MVGYRDEVDVYSPHSLKQLVLWLEQHVFEALSSEERMALSALHGPDWLRGPFHQVCRRVHVFHLLIGIGRTKKKKKKKKKKKLTELNCTAVSGDARLTVCIRTGYDRPTTCVCSSVDVGLCH